MIQTIDHEMCLLFSKKIFQIGPLGWSSLLIATTVVPVMKGQPRDQAKVSVHCRWPLVTGTDGQAGTPNIIHLAILPTTITTSDIPNEYTHCHNFVRYTSKPKSNAT